MEREVRTFSPSQWINFKYYMLCLLLSPLVVGIVMFIVRWLITKNKVYVLTNERLIIKSGVFSKLTNEIELYRVKDVTLIEPFWLRLLGVSEIKLITSDKQLSELLIKGVKNGVSLKDSIRKLVDVRRDEKGVKERDL